MVSDGREAGGAGAQGAATGGRPRRTEKTPNARLEAELAAARTRIVGLEQQLGEQERWRAQALEQQTATTEVLQVISRSAFDLTAVLGTLLEHAVRLCGAVSGMVLQYDGHVCRWAADHGISDALREFVLRHPAAPGRSSLTGRVMSTRRVVHIPDVLADPEYDYGGLQVAPYRSLLGVRCCGTVR